MFKAVANSPAALRMMWGAFGALGGGTLSPKVGEQIAVAIANRNRCEYCLAAHTALGRKAGASAEEMARAQAGRSDDRSEEHTSELQSLMRISYAVFCLKKKKHNTNNI